MTRNLTRGGVVIMGRWIPQPVAGLAGLTAALSILSALWSPVLFLGVLVPQRVLAGEAWRLLTWTFIETQPLSLVFACLMAVWLGPDLCQAWGAGRYVALYLGCAAASGTVTSLLALLFPETGLLAVPYASAWAAIEPIVIAWAWLYPNRQILMYFVLPVRGRTLIQLTIGLTALFAVFHGWQLFVPHFIAQALMLLYLDRLRFVRKVWLRLRLLAYERRLRRRAAHLTVVRRDDDRRPPTYH